jgi:hypothetical protein
LALTVSPMVVLAVVVVIDIEFAEQLEKGGFQSDGHTENRSSRASLQNARFTYHLQSRPRTAFSRSFFFALVGCPEGEAQPIYFFNFLR